MVFKLGFERNWNSIHSVSLKKWKLSFNYSTLKTILLLKIILKILHQNNSSNPLNTD
jgi:hypothetical protein